MWFPDEEALTKRFTDHGLPAPAFKTIDGVRSALVADPDGEWVHLVVAPNAPKDTYGRLEIGIAANDLEKSRAFYRTFVGLDELPPVKDPVIGVTKYPFRHGSTTISVWATPGPKPVNPRLAGIQYVVKPVDPIWALAQQRAIPVETAARRDAPGTGDHVALRSRRGHELLRGDSSAPAARTTAAASRQPAEYRAPGRVQTAVPSSPPFFSGCRCWSSSGWSWAPAGCSRATSARGMRVGSASRCRSGARWARRAWRSRRRSRCS